MFSEDRFRYYINGNYIVLLDGNNKEYRSLRVDDKTFRSSFPDSIDLKITNKCNFNCPYCHESSTSLGKTMDYDRTISVLSKLPFVGIELAIGGGDVLECWDETYKLLNWCKDKFLTRITLNCKDFFYENNKDKIKKLMQLVGAIGISINGDMSMDALKQLQDDARFYCRVVYHVIVGVNPIQQILDLIYSKDMYNSFDILVLGYKNWGRGKTYTPDFTDWSEEFKKFLFNCRISPREIATHVGFDNLAIEQLGIKDSMLKSEWKSMYMGDEFTHSMYIDAVSETYGPTSRDPFRVSWKDMDVLEFFKQYRKEDEEH